MGKDSDGYTERYAGPGWLAAAKRGACISCGSTHVGRGELQTVSPTREATRCECGACGTFWYEYFGRVLVGVALDLLQPPAF